MHICFVNGCAAYGGPERLIEDWASRLEDFKLSYLFSPYPGSEVHADRMAALGAEVCPLPELVPAFFPRNIPQGTEKTDPASPGPAPKPSLKSHLVRQWKRWIPSSIDEAIYYRRVTAEGANLFARHLARLNPDVIHYNVAVNSWLSAGLEGALQGCPRAGRLVHIHNPPVFHHMTAKDRRLLGSIDQFAFVSHATAKQWEQELPPQAEVQVVQNGIPVDLFVPGTVSSNHETTRFVMCTRLTPMKAVDVAIDAFSKLSASGVNATLQIAGTGPDEETLKQQVKSLGLEEQIQFLGLQQDVRPLYQSADVYIQTSRSTEGLPLSLLESMASGLPSIATDVGGTCEAVHPGITGWKVTVEDADALAEAMKTACADRDKTRSMGEAARELAQTSFSMTRMVEELKILYTDLSTKRGPAA